ncbi:unnamed protein product [Brassica rapa subsp. narinosa]
MKLSTVLTFNPSNPLIPTISSLLCFYFDVLKLLPSCLFNPSSSSDSSSLSVSINISTAQTHFPSLRDADAVWPRRNLSASKRLASLASALASPRTDQTVFVELHEPFEAIPTESFRFHNYNQPLKYLSKCSGTNISPKLFGGNILRTITITCRTVLYLNAISATHLYFGNEYFGNECDAGRSYLQSGDDHPVDDMPGAGAVKRSPIDGVNSSGVNEGEGGNRSEDAQVNKSKLSPLEINHGLSDEAQQGELKL